jgi:rhodanese-related sulfurtransferase
MSTDDAVPEVSADEARSLVHGGALLLDVREPDEWAAGHAPDAQFIPLGEVAARTSEIARDASIVVVCRVGGRSARATAFLRSEGYDAVNLTGGMRAWAASGHDVVVDGGAPGTVI